jgi:hypothetical protein
LPVAATQSFTSLSLPPLAIVAPSREKATQVAAPEWAATVFTSAPVAVSQITTVPSSPAVASFVPSGEKSSDRTQPLCFLRSCFADRAGRSQSLTRPS